MGAAMIFSNFLKLLGLAGGVTAKRDAVTGGIGLTAGGVDVMAAMSAVVTASRNAALSDSGNLLKCTSASAIVITIQNDATTLWSANETIGAYQGGAGAVSFAAGSGVTFRGTAPTALQYSTQGIMRVGASEWAYL